MKQRIQSAIYSKEFREQAVKLVTEEGLSAKEAARRLSLPVSTLKAAQAGKRGEIGKAQRPLTEVELELTKTKRELAEVKMERDLLKKTAAYFAREERSEGFCGEVRDDEGIAGRLSRAVHVSYLRSFAERLLRLAGASAIKACTG